jgi:hypothetical protein
VPFAASVKCRKVLGKVDQRVPPGRINESMIPRSDTITAFWSSTYCITLSYRTPAE